MAVAYPGPSGRPLYLSTYTGAGGTSQISFPVNPVIATSAYSDSEPMNQGQKAVLSVVYATAPAVATDIEFDVDPRFLNAFVIDTLPITADKINIWQSTELLSGFIRIHNTSTSVISSVNVQQLVATTG